MALLPSPLTESPVAGGERRMSREIYAVNTLMSAFDLEAKSASGASLTLQQPYASRHGAGDR